MAKNHEQDNKGYDNEVIQKLFDRLKNSPLPVSMSDNDQSVYSDSDMAVIGEKFVPLEEGELQEKLEKISTINGISSYNLIRTLSSKNSEYGLRWPVAVIKDYQPSNISKKAIEKQAEFKASIKSTHPQFATFFERDKICFCVEPSLFNTNPSQENGFFNNLFRRYLPQEIHGYLVHSLNGNYIFLERILDLSLRNNFVFDESLPQSWESVPQITLDLLDCLFGFVDIPDTVLEKLLYHPYEEIVLLALLAMKKKISEETLKNIITLRFKSNILNDGFLAILESDQKQKGYTNEQISEIAKAAKIQIPYVSLLKNTASYYFKKYFGKK